MFASRAQAEIAQELERAQKARLDKNEGMARVCARRAAGLAARAYLSHRGDSPPNCSALDALTILRDHPDVPLPVRQCANHLTLRLTRDHELPVAVDLLVEAKNIISQLELLRGGKIDR